MGLVKTRRRLAEDMHRRGEASEGTLPKATRRARKRVRSPHRAARPESAPYRAGAGVLPMWECCQFQCCQFPNLGRGVWRGEDRFGILLGGRKTEMATKCRHCSSTSCGHGCAYGCNLLPCCV